ncbi:BlaI/MecI/CopY family transcriptional regulator [Aminipila luticellarii]|uniref:BlaI/MecI/CopY family transcriptional regulator n=1 Tax=Aminipila luticellarii TaxID=2507160 RepID=A0A410PVM7_9FIRM|nr:BlaI/MecI/CopY family transcriptional regulator [Aminipila luticellarii]QAT42999.1 BlaI/MecI/CopY family transcriptional regulator [Aminipila luticellarii]
MKHLPAAQLEVMLAVWEADEPITRNEIQRKLPDSQWKITTLNTLLNRLTQNGFLNFGHRGKEYVYSPLVTKDEYVAFEGKSILKNLYDNSIKKFVASVCNSSDLTEQEISSLQTLLSKLKEGDTCD